MTKTRILLAALLIYVGCELVAFAVSPVSGGNGQVAISGTPLSNDLAQWTDAATIKGLTPGAGVVVALGQVANDGAGGFITGNGTVAVTNKTINTSANFIQTNFASYSSNQVLTTDKCYGSLISVSGAATITLPAGSTGMSVVVVTQGAVAVNVKPNGSEVLVLDGTALTAAHKATNTSHAGDLIVLTFEGSGTWYAASNTWTDGGL